MMNAKWFITYSTLTNDFAQQSQENHLYSFTPSKLAISQNIGSSWQHRQRLTNG